MRNTKLLSIITVLTLMTGLQSQALTRFPKGTCKLQGRIVKALNEPNWYFIVNPGTMGETRFKLQGFQPKIELDPKGDLVQVQLEISKDTLALYGEAKILEIQKFLNPFEDIELYTFATEAARACTSGRAPASADKIKK